MYKNILVLLDGSFYSYFAAKYAIKIAENASTKLSFLYIKAAEETSHQLKTVENYAEKLFTESEKKGVVSEIVIKKGDIQKDTIAFIKANNIDLVFKNLRREEERSILNPFLNWWLIKLPCSTIFMKVVHLGKLTPKRILVPLEDKIYAKEERAELLISLSKAFNATIELMHIKKENFEFIEEDVSPDISAILKKLSKEGALLVRKKHKGFEGHLINIESATKKADLVVLGMTRRGIFKGLVAKTPLVEVIKHTTSNLMVFRAK